MNLYIRYFDRETLVSNVDEAIEFLRSLQEIPITPELEAEIREYAASDVLFPRRYKVLALGGCRTMYDDLINLSHINNHFVGHV